MGKRKRRVISISEFQQKSTEVEHLNEQRLTAAKPSADDSIPPSNQQQSSTSEATNSIQSDYAAPPKKVRKHTRLQDIWDLEGYRIQVTFDETGQPVGEEGKDLTNFLGTLVKMPQHLSLEFLDWRKVPENKKADLWNIVKEKFEFLPSETKEIRKWVLSDMGMKFKSWRYELKKKLYDSASTINDIVDAQNDSRVDKTQFKKLVTHWCNQKTEVESETKKKVRSMYNEPHVTGTKSFARLIHDEMKKNNGVRPSRGTIYRISRTRKDGSVVNASASLVVEMKEIKESKERQEAEIREMKINQEAMVRFMAIFKEQLPNASLFNVFNGLNKQVGMDSCGAHNHHLSGNPTSSLASQYPSSGSIS